MLRISGAGESHVGLVRPNNQDSAFVGPTCMLVADGVGGGAAGEVASATTAYAVAASALLHAGEDPAGVLREGVRVAQAQVRAGVLADDRRAGMATTLTAVFTDGKEFVLAHLGDSRGYVFRDGELTRVTRDHTYVQELLDEAGSTSRAPPATRGATSSCARSTVPRTACQTSLPSSSSPAIASCWPATDSPTSWRRLR